MDIKKRIQELSLDQKAKLYFMGLVRQGKIDRLPEDPKAAYVSMMMDKDDYGRSISGKDKRTFMEPEDSMPAARARKLAGMEDDDMETRYDFDDPVFEGDTYEKMAAKGKKRGNLKQGTVRKRLKIKDGEKIPLSKITKAISKIKKMKNPSEKNKKYLKALNLAKTLKTTTNVREMANELGYLNEDKQETIIPLDKLTFDMLKQVFSDDYKNVQFTRTQPDGKEGNYYRDSITFPNIDDSRTSIGDMSALEDWKEKTKSRYGNVDILLKPEADMWFDKVEVIDDKFQNTKNKLAQGKAAAMKRDQELGRSID